ncbi:MAG: hypothetical protein V1767_07540 [Chloroflexota bacterium]
MTDSNKKTSSSSISCPYCNAPSGGAFSTVTEEDASGPSKVLYKCNNCGRFYTAQKVVTWQVKKE